MSITNWSGVPQQITYSDGGYNGNPFPLPIYGEATSLDCSATAPLNNWPAGNYILYIQIILTDGTLSANSDPIYVSIT